MSLRNALDRLHNLREFVESASLMEAAPTTADELGAALQQAVKKHFPKSFFEVKFSKGLKAGTGNLVGVFSLIANTSDITSGIRDNDRAFHKFMIRGMDDQGNLEDRQEVELLTGGSLMVKPEPGSHMAFGSVKFGWRKKAGTADQIVKHFDQYFAKVEKVVADNEEQIPPHR